MQFARQYLYSHVIQMDYPDFPYTIVIGYNWLLKFVGVLRFEQYGSNHEQSMSQFWNIMPQIMNALPWKVKEDMAPFQIALL